jgi:proteasome lid subunit RPN8/RPN11
VAKVGRIPDGPGPDALRAQISRAAPQETAEGNDLSAERLHQASGSALEAVVVDREVLRTLLGAPNARAQLAWEIRTRLERILGKETQAAHAARPSSAADVLRDAIQRGHLTFDVVLRLVDWLCPDEPLVKEDLLVARLLAAAPDELAAHLPADDRAARLTQRAPIAAANENPPAQQTVETGRDVVTELLSAPASVNLLDPGCPATPAAWGRLCAAMELSSARELLPTLSTRPDLRDQALDFLRQDYALRSEMVAAADCFSPTGASTSHAALAASHLAEQARELARAGGEHQVLGEWLDRISKLFPADQAAAAREHARREAEADLAQLADHVQALRTMVGDAAMEPICDRVDWQSVLRTPGLYAGIGADAGGLSIRPQLQYLAQALTDAAVRAKSLEIVQAAARDPALSRLAGAISDLAEPDLMGQLAALVVRAYADVTPLPDESASAFGCRLLTEVADEGARASLVHRLRDDVQQDSDGVATDIEGMGSALRQVAATSHLADTAWNAFEADLAGRTLSISVEAARDLREHVHQCYPFEALGCLVSDGGVTRFVPIKNLLAGEPDGTHMGLYDPGELGQLHATLRLTGLSVVAMVHSHPESSAVFSDGDLAKMRGTVAAFPETRTLIVAIHKKNGRASYQMASFASAADGQVVGEDRIEVA